MGDRHACTHVTRLSRTYIRKKRRRTDFRFATESFLIQTEEERRECVKAGSFNHWPAGQKADYNWIYVFVCLDWEKSRIFRDARSYWLWNNWFTKGDQRSFEWLLQINISHGKLILYSNWLYNYKQQKKNHPVDEKFAGKSAFGNQ